MRNQVVKGFALGMITGSFLTAGVVLLATPAKADGMLSTDEQVYVEMYGAAVCMTLDNYPTYGGVMGIAQAIQEDGFAPDDAVDIINAAVSVQCDQYWPLLQAIGRAARASVA
jgi:hypothetical protein